MATGFSVGFVLFVATIIVISALFWVGSGQGVFANRVEYEVLCPSVSGLSRGSQVKLNGVPVGTVDSIRFTQNIKVNKILVTLSVDEEVTPRIRRDSSVWLQTEGLLGDKEVHIGLGTAGQPPLPPGSRIPFVEKSLLEDLAGGEITTNTTNFLELMIAVLQDIQRGEGTIGQLVKNPELYSNLNSFLATLDQLGGELRRMSSELNGVLSEVRSQRGLMGKLIFSQKYEQLVSSMLDESRSLVAELASIVHRTGEGSGSLGKVVTEDRLHDEAVIAIQEVTSLSRSLNDTLTKLRASGGIAGRLLEDEESGERFARLLERLERSSASLEAILAAVEKGEGSVGMAIKDPSIATSIRNLFLGVQELGYVQSLVRNAEMIGQELSLRDLRASSGLLEEERVIRERATEAGPPETDGGEEGGSP